MTKSKYLVLILAAVLVTLWSVNQARASYDYTILGDGGLLGGFSVSVDGTTESGILVGGIHVTSASGVPGYNDFTTVCVDLNGRIYLGDTYAFNEVAFAGQSGLNPSWGNPIDTPPSTAIAYQAINNAAYLLATFHPTDATGWAALQLAVWKATYDTGPNGTIVWGSAARFVVNSYAGSGAWAEAQQWLNSLPRNTDYIGYLLEPEDTSAQELFIDVTPVPETTTLITGALLLLPLGATTLRFSRRHRAP